MTDKRTTIDNQDLPLEHIIDLGEEPGTYEICHKYYMPDKLILSFENVGLRGKFLRKDKETGYSYFEFLLPEISVDE